MIVYIRQLGEYRVKTLYLLQVLNIINLNDYNL